MDKEVERKISLLHTVYGIVMGVVFGLYVKGGSFTFITVLVLALVLSYPMLFICRRIFNLSQEEFMIKDWLKKGYYFFLVTWMVVWVFLYNLA